MSDSHAPVHADERALSSRLFELFDRLWPHVAAWGLAALLSFFAVRERLTMMELKNDTLIERVKVLEESERSHSLDIRGIRENTAASKTMLEALVKEAEERRGEERRAYRDRMERER